MLITLSISGWQGYFSQLLEKRTLQEELIDLVVGAAISVSILSGIDKLTGELFIGEIGSVVDQVLLGL